jgi:hypothetical protein
VSESLWPPGVPFNAPRYDGAHDQHVQLRTKYGCGCIVMRYWYIPFEPSESFHPPDGPDHDVRVFGGLGPLECRCAEGDAWLKEILA